MKCPNCSNECNEKNAFCPFCGTKIEVPIVKKKFVHTVEKVMMKKIGFVKTVGIILNLLQVK